MRNVYQGCLLYATDNDYWLPYTGFNAEYAWYINDYLKQSLEGGFESINGMSRALAFGKTKGVFFCPSLEEPPSPGWDGSPVGRYYRTNYMPTLFRADAATYSGENSGCWLNWSNGGSQLVNLRRLERIKDGCVIVGDQNWGHSNASINLCESPQSGYITAFPFGFIYIRYSPGWMHQFSSNFLFKDGHVTAYKHSMVRQFDEDYVPVN